MQRRAFLLPSGLQILMQMLKRAVVEQAQ